MQKTRQIRRITSHTLVEPHHLALQDVLEIFVGLVTQNQGPSAHDQTTRQGLLVSHVAEGGWEADDVSENVVCCQHATCHFGDGPETTYTLLRPVTIRPHAKGTYQTTSDLLGRRTSKYLDGPYSIFGKRGMCHRFDVSYIARANMYHTASFVANMWEACVGDQLEANHKYIFI